MALSSDPSSIKQGIERHQSSKLPIPLEVNIGGRNLKISDYNELFDLNKINGNSRRITTLTIKTVSTYKQKLDRSISSDQLVNKQEQQLNQLNNNVFNNGIKHKLNEERNKDLQFDCESASIKNFNDKENLINQQTKDDLIQKNNSINKRLNNSIEREFKQYKIEKSIEIEPKLRIIDDQQLNNKQKLNDNEQFLRNSKRSASLRQINNLNRNIQFEQQQKLNNINNLNERTKYFVSDKFTNHLDDNQQKMSNKPKEFYFNGTNQNKMMYKEEIDNLTTNLNNQKLNNSIEDKQIKDRKFKEHLNASLNSSFNSNYNLGLQNKQQQQQKDGNNNRNYTGPSQLTKQHQFQTNTNTNTIQQFNTKINPQQKQLNQFNTTNQAYLEQYHQNQQFNSLNRKKQNNRKLSAGGNQLDEINCDEFVSELKSKILNNNQATSSPATVNKLNNFQSNNLIKNERQPHLILDTSTLPHLNNKQQSINNNKSNLNSSTLPLNKSSYLTSSVRRNESFQKATENYRIKMEPKMRSIRSSNRDNKDIKQQSTINNNPNINEIDKLDSEQNTPKLNQQRFSYLGSQAANGYQTENFVRSNDNLANVTGTTDDWNTTLDTNTETRSDRSIRQFKKCDKYGFFINDDNQPQKSKSNKTGSIKKDDEKTKKTNSEIDKRREMKWLDMLQNWDKYMQKRWNKICERCRKGIPPSLRGTSWFHLCAAHKQKRNKPDLYRFLCQQKGNESINDEIIKDLHRQFPTHEMFHGTNTKGQQDLFTILKNFSIIKPEIGYCQGEAPIVSVLLMHIPDPEDVFFVLIQLCDHYLNGYFTPGLETLQVHGKMLNSILKRYNNTVYKILKKQKIDATMYMTEWFMCVFARTLEWPLVLRIWDIFFCEGIKVVFRVALVILDSLEPELKKAKCNQNDKLIETLEILKKIPKKYLEIDYLLPRVIEMNLSEKDLETEHYNLLKKMKKKKK